MQPAELERVFVRSLILAGLIVAVCASLAVLGYFLLVDYLEALILAFITSLAIKPVSDSMCAKFSSYADGNFGAFKDSVLMWLLKSLRSLCYLNMPFRAPTSYNIVLILSGAYLLLTRAKLTNAGLIILAGLLLEAFLSLLVDLLCKVIKKSAIPAVAALCSMVRTVVFALSILVLFSFALIMSISEVKEHSQGLLDGLYDMLEAENPWSWLPTEAPNNGTCTVLWVNLLDVVPEGLIQVTELIEFSEDALTEYSLSSGLLASIYSQHVSHMDKFAFELVPFLAKHGVFGLVMLLLSLTDFLVKLFVFVTFVQIFLRTDIFYHVRPTQLVLTLPISDQLKNSITGAVTIGVHDLYVSLFKIASTKFIVTWVTFDILKLPFKFSHALMSAVIGLLPLFSGILVSLPFIAWLFARGEILRPGVLGVSQYFLEQLVGYILAEGEASLNSYTTLFCIATGLYSFGVVGVIYGPLIGFGASVFLGLVNHLQAKPSKEAQDIS
jgi:predicted PurR-regulated permease PerM